MKTGSIHIVIFVLVNFLLIACNNVNILSAKKVESVINDSYSYLAIYEETGSSTRNDTLKKNEFKEFGLLDSLDDISHVAVLNAMVNWEVDEVGEIEEMIIEVSIQGELIGQLNVSVNEVQGKEMIDLSIGIATFKETILNLIRNDEELMIKFMLQPDNLVDQYKLNLLFNLDLSIIKTSCEDVPLGLELTDCD